MTFLTHGLTLATCLLLALPPGWCCFAEAGSCCDDDVQPAAVVPENGGDDACPHCRRGAGGPLERDSAASTQPFEAPCCCEAQPATRTFANLLPDLPLALTSPTGDPCFVAASASFLSPPSEIVAGGRRLHLLHCQWRC